MKSLWLTMCLTPFLPAPVFAIQDERPGPEPVAVVVPKKAHATDFTLGLAFQGPTRLTGSATLMWGEPKMLVAWAPAKLAQVRVGTRGAQVGLGFVAGVFEESAWRPSGLAVTLKAIALRTWRDPSGVTNSHSYVGIESDVVLLGVRGSIGYARKVAGRGGPDGRFVWSLGVGL
ncbi:MAG: hypothetical protein JJE39_05910 [Vicinamibacteria bacterium]|nr:hypothetical protein [Vicinamibacteria bacterium]